MNMIALKRGLNFIIGGKAYSAQELLAVQRKIIRVLLVLLVIGVPVAGYVGYLLHAPEVRIVPVAQ
jgi:hypothetical protein